MAMQIATVAGPAIGGFIFAIRPELPYEVALVLFALSGACALSLRSRAAAPGPQAAEHPTGRVLLPASASFERRLCSSARSRSTSSPFSWAARLRSRLSSRARSCTLAGRARAYSGQRRRSAQFCRSDAHPAAIDAPRRPHASSGGRAFGASMIVFGLSRSFPLSLGALAVSGFVDMVSMNIRATTAAWQPPTGCEDA